MPGISLAREIPLGDADQICHRESLLCMSAEEQAAAEESLSAYCKPMELYNFIRHRAVKKPLFRQRCLRYKLEAKHPKRIQLTVSLYVPVDNEFLQIQTLLPLYIMLAASASNFSTVEQSHRYYFKRCFTLKTCAGDGGASQFMARFVLPESNKLLEEIRSGSYSILFISRAQGGECMLGTTPMELIDLTCGRSPNLSEGSETILTVDLHPCAIETSVDGENCVSFRAAPTPTILASKQRLEVIFIAQEFGAIDQLPFGSYSSSEVPSSSLSHITRLENGNAVFNYMYYNKLQRTEVTEGFSCPFCSRKCASFKGLKCHLLSFHDLFKFEFQTTDGYFAVNVNVKTDTRRSEIVADGVDAKTQTFFFWSKTRNRRQSKSIFRIGNNVRPPVPESDHHPMETNELHDVSIDRRASDQNTARISHETAPSTDPEGTVPLPESSITTLRSMRSRKRLARHEPNIGSLLQRRQFFHSRNAQPMAIEQVLSELDSEDEIDHDIVDLEDRIMLGDFVDVTNTEKQLMQMWNSFTRRQRVLANSHVPWACEHLSRLNAAHFIATPPLLACWNIFMIKLWNHRLLNERCMDTCNQILRSWIIEHDNSNPVESHGIDGGESNKIILIL